MTEPNCIKCGGTEFEATVKAIDGARYPGLLIHCSGCGGVIGGCFDLTPDTSGELVPAKQPLKRRKG